MVSPTRQLTRRVVRAVNLRLSFLTRPIILISAAYQEMLVAELTHFHTPELDELMTRIGPPCTLTMEEAERMEMLLEARSGNVAEITAAERQAARLLPFIIRRTIAETSSKGRTEDVLVSRPALVVK